MNLSFTKAGLASTECPRHKRPALIVTVAIKHPTNKTEPSLPIKLQHYVIRRLHGCSPL